EFINGRDLRARCHRVVVIHVADRAGSSAGIGGENAAALKNAERFDGEGIKEAFGNLIIRKGLPDHAAAAGGLAGGIVDGNYLAGRIHPLTEIPVIHFCRGDRGGEGRRSLAIAEAFISEKEKRFVLAVVNLRNKDRTSDAEAEIVLLVDSAGKAAPVAEESVRVEVGVAEKLVSAAVEIVRAGL